MPNGERLFNEYASNSDSGKSAIVSEPMSVSNLDDHPAPHFHKLIYRHCFVEKDSVPSPILNISELLSVIKDM